MVKKITEGKAGIFIDAANLSKSVEGLGYKINYRKLRQYFAKQYTIVYLGFYTVAFASKKHQEFLKALRAKHFTVITKPLKIIWDHHQSSEVKKANFDVEIAVDAILKIDQFETLILFSGDSDFDYLIKQLKHRDKRAIVFSTRYHVSKELIKSCDEYHDLIKFQDVFLRKK